MRQGVLSFAQVPVYEETLEDNGRFNEQPVLPFNAYGTVAMARSEFEANDGSSQFFFLLKVRGCDTFWRPLAPFEYYLTGLRKLVHMLHVGVCQLVSCCSGQASEPERMADGNARAVSLMLYTCTDLCPYLTGAGERAHTNGQQLTGRPLCGVCLCGRQCRPAGGAAGTAQSDRAPPDVQSHVHLWPLSMVSTLSGIAAGILAMLLQKLCRGSLYAQDFSKAMSPV